MAGEQYQVILADPPWPFRDRLDKSRRLDRHYETLSMADIERFLERESFAEHIASNAVLFLWVPNALLPDGLRIMSAWGFVYKAKLTWVKMGGFGMGRIVRNASENLLIGTRGRPERRNASQLDWFTAPVGAHSAKPHEQYAIIERLYDGPYLELFARRRQAGWYAFGDQLP